MGVSILCSFRRTWNRFWFSEAEPLPAALFRISFGFLLLSFFVSLLPHFTEYYSAQGILSLDLLDPHRLHQDRHSVFYWTDGWIPTQGLGCVGILAAACFTLGWKTRWAAVALFVLQTSMINTSRNLINGEDLLFRSLLFFSCFAPLDQRLSLRNWIERRSNHRDSQEQAAPQIWPLRLIQLNLLLIYLISLPSKLISDSAWLNGDALYWVMSNEIWCRWPWPSHFYGWLGKVATYSTVLTEGLFPFAVWIPGLRIASLVAIAVLHLGMAIFMQNMGFFALGMVCALWVFVPQSLLTKLGDRRATLSKPTANIESS